MLAIQFQAVKQPEIRDTRDTWQLREDLQKEMELQSKLIKEIRSNEEKIANYETERRHSQEQALLKTLEELKEEAGLTEITGPGLVITLDRFQNEPLFEKFSPFLSPDTIRRLINELNMYGAEHISIAGQRIINTTVIREIAGETKINGRTIRGFPIEILVITEDMKKAESMFNRLMVSRIKDDFFIDNLSMSISQPKGEMTIPPYDGEIRVQNVQLMPVDKGEN